MSLNYIRIAKTPDVERVLSDLRARFSLLNEAEIIKLALSEVHNREMGDKLEREQKLREAFKRAVEEGGKRGDELLAQKGIKRENMTEQQYMMPSSNLLKGNLKLIIDTNLFISVFVFRGKMVMRIFELILDNTLTMYVSPKLRQELDRKLAFFGVNKQVHDDVMLFFDTNGISVDPDISIN